MISKKVGFVDLLKLKAHAELAWDEIAGIEAGKDEVEVACEVRSFVALHLIEGPVGDQVGLEGISLTIAELGQETEGSER